MLTRILVAALASIVAVNAAPSAIRGGGVLSPPSPSFEAFAVHYNKQYATGAERLRRQRIYEDNLRDIARLNALPEGTAVFEVNGFADLTPAEFEATYMMANADVTGNLHARAATHPAAANNNSSAPAAVPAEKNWFLKATTPRRAQGQCGSCWAFSAVEQVESDWFLAGKAGAKPEALSVQQVVDCDTAEAYGCSGEYAGGGSGFDYVMKNGGLASEAAYPYVSGTTGEAGKCKQNITIAGGTITGHKYAVKPCDMPWDDCNDQDEDAVAAYVGSKGPLAICVNAKNWQFYKKGVATASLCGGHDHASLDHCVQLVGYSGYDAGKGAKGSGAKGAYWIVRNSWRAPWGIGGLIYLSMGNNTCGMADVPSYTVVG